MYLTYCPQVFSDFCEAIEKIGVSPTKLLAYLAADEAACRKVAKLLPPPRPDLQLSDHPVSSRVSSLLDDVFGHVGEVRSSRHLMEERYYLRYLNPEQLHSLLEQLTEPQRDVILLLYGLTDKLPPQNQWDVAKTLGRRLVSIRKLELDAIKALRNAGETLKLREEGLTPLVDLGLPTAAYRLLYNKRIRTAEDLVLWTERRLLAINRLGPVLLVSIKKSLASRGLALAVEESDTSLIRL